MSPPPLAGVSVLDFSRVLAGPMATQILAELGAEVIKVERPGRGDESRAFEPQLPHGESAYFFAFNRGKRSVALDLKAPAGQGIARDLAARADVVVENFLPGTMDGFGLGHEALAAINPGLVQVSCTGFGQTGPDRERKGYDTIFQALSGFMSLTGSPGGPPAKAGIPVADMTSALWIVIAALAGLSRRASTGRGSYIDLAIMDVQVSLLSLAAARLFALDEDLAPAGTEHPGRVPSAAFECADGRWLQVSASDQHWERLCAVLRLDELGADPALRSNAGRLDARARVMDALRRAIAGRERAELADALRAADVPIGEVNTVREALDDPRVRERGMVGELQHPSEGAFPALGLPLRLDGSRPAEVAPPPLLGADTEAVLREKLGLSSDAVSALRSEGVIA